jgi:hypothetical protein
MIHNNIDPYYRSPLETNDKRCGPSVVPEWVEVSPGVYEANIPAVDCAELTIYPNDGSITFGEPVELDGPLVFHSPRVRFE